MLKVKKSIGSQCVDIVIYVFMLFLMVLMLYPMLNVVAVSFSDPSSIVAGKVTWFPRGWNTNGYAMILAKKEFYIYYKNTILYAFIGTFLSLLFTSMAAYSLSLKEYAFRKFLTIFWVITMFFSGGLVPTYLVIKALNGIDKFWVMVIPSCISAYNIIVFRTFFEQQPKELRESAVIDGANDFIIWARIVIPLAKPLLATFALFGIVAHWNSWFSALLYLRSSSKYPLQMLLRKLVINEDLTGGYADDQIAILVQMGALNPKNMQMAAIVVTMLPILCIYPYIQKYFTKGVMIGAIKG